MFKIKANHLQSRIQKAIVFTNRFSSSAGKVNFSQMNEYNSGSLQIPKVSCLFCKIAIISICSVLYFWQPVLAQTVTKQLYLSDPTQALDRIDPVATADGTTSQTVALTPTAQYLYAFRGASKIDFWRYDIAANTWTAMANAPNTVTRGAALTTDGTFIYALRGAANSGGNGSNANLDFWKYNPASNTWSVLANTPDNYNSGAALTFVNGAIYAFKGWSTTSFWKYTIATNIWSVMSPTPSSSTVDWGGALTTNGTDIFALRGTGTSTFWKYTVATNTWSVLAALPMAIDGGGSLSFDGTSILAFRGGNFNSAYKYNLTTNSWTSISNTPNTVFKGASLVSDDANSYAVRGSNSSNFWRFNGSAWSNLANTPSSVDSGGALIKFGLIPASTTFTQAPALCSDLTVKAGTIKVSTYISMVYGTMPVNPAITATLSYGATPLLTLSNPVYSSVTGMLTWTAILATDKVIPAGQAISLNISASQQGVSFKIEYDSQTKPSKIDFPVSTYINVGALNVYTLPYPGGTIVNNVQDGVTRYIRTVVSDPFGFSDINGVDVTINPPGTTSASAFVAGAGCTSTYESIWTVGIAVPSYTITATAKEGYENTVTHSKSIGIVGCSDCPPNAIEDTATVVGGESRVIDVLANDSDPNNNIDPGTLTVTGLPKNGDFILDNNKITYIPNGTYSGKDTLTYQVCDLTSPTPLCASAKVIVSVLPVVFNTCSDAVKSKIYYIPYAENEAQIALQKSASGALPTTDIRTIISIKVSYPGITLIWDNWEDGYETNILNPVQSTTEIWGDGNIFNGIAPGYPTDVIPAGGSIVLDNTMPTPRVVSNIFYDGEDKLYSSGQISVTQVCGEPSTIAVQCMKTNVAAFPTEFGKSFTIPVGEDLPSRDFLYTAYFIRAAQNNTSIQIDRDNDGDFETKFILNEGQVMLVDDATAPAGTKLKAGALVISDKPIGVDAHFGGIDGYSSREVPIFPASWYSNTYYTPVPTTGPGTAPYDTAVVMLYNSLNRAININWSSGVPSSGTIVLPANSSVRFPMNLSASAAYKFTNPTLESFIAIEIADSYTPGGGGNDGSTRDWAFNLISETRLTDFASVAWAPGSTDMTRNDNPVWVTPTANTTLYVKYDGDVLNGPSTSPCGLKYDVAIALNALNYTKIKDPADNDQSGTSVYTCNGAKIAAIYGEDATTALAGNPSWDVGTTIQPFCKEKLVFANNDFAVALVNTPVNIPVLKNDAAFLTTIDPASVTTIGLLQPKNGTIIINSNGTIIYFPNAGFVGNDTFQYNVCSVPVPTPVVCATATVFITIGSCPTPAGQNIITGMVFADKNQDGINNDGGRGFSPAKIYLFNDGNCDGNINTNELLDSVTVDGTGRYQFTKLPEKIVADNFDLSPSGNSCASGSDGSAPWVSNWTDAGDASIGFCVTPAQTAANTDVEIVPDSTFGFALRLDDGNKSAIRQFNMQNATKAFLDFSYRRASASFTSSEDVLVQLSKDGITYNTVFTISGNGTINANYVNVSNLGINVAAYNTTNKTYLRFLTNANVDEGDNIFIDNIKVKFLQYDQCYIVRIDSASFPANSKLVSIAIQKVKFTSAGICMQPLEFGVTTISTYVVNDENSTWQDVNVSGVVTINDFDQENNLQSFGSFLHPTTSLAINSGDIVSGKDKTGATVANAGVLIFTNTGSYTFDPSPGFTGTVTVPYVLCDNGSIQACDTAYLAITVDPLPTTGNSVIANNDEDISYGTSITNNLFVNDRDPKNYPFSMVLFSYDTNGDGIPDVTTIPGSAIVAGINIFGKPVLNAGTLSVTSAGNYTFTPASGFTGGIDATYTITNSAGAVASANLHIEVLGDPNSFQNDPPFAGDDFGYTTVNKIVNGSFIVNDSDPNGNNLSINGTLINKSGAQSPIGAAVATSQGGSVQFYTNGTYAYTPPAGYIGPDLITYAVCDVTTTLPQPLCANASLHLLVGPGINISGKVWIDANGNVIDDAGAELKTNVGGQLYVNLVDAGGYVISVTAVASDGTYSFTNVAPGNNYSLELSNTQGVPGAVSIGPALPSGWINTGETRNGTIDYGSSGVIDNRAYNFTDVSNMDFGIEQLPNSDYYDVRIKTPNIGQFIFLNGISSLPVPSGADAEDCNPGCNMNNRTLIIDIPTLNANLYYNGILVTAGQLITNFDSSLLKIEITTVTLGSVNTQFSYSFVDVAGRKDPTPAVYTVGWFNVLPVKGLNLTATRTGTEVSLNWKTLSEINSDYFEVERSTDGRNYSKIGKSIKAAGNSADLKTYELQDDISDIKTGNVVYYRVKLKDVNSKLAYSNVVIVKLPANGSIKVLPNPFVSSIIINMPVDQNTSLSIRILDISGRAILSTTQKITKEWPQVTINNLNNLRKGFYLVEVIDMQSDKKAVSKIEKIN